MNTIQAAGIGRVRIRSVPSCESARGVCALCCGRDLATGKLVEMGLAVGPEYLVEPEHIREGLAEA